MSDSGFLYAIGIPGGTSVKIGKTTKSVAQRLATLQISHPDRLHVLAHVRVADGLSKLERAIHTLLAAERQQGEWFAVTIDQGALDALLVRAVQWLQDERDIGKFDEEDIMGTKLKPYKHKTSIAFSDHAKHLLKLLADKSGTTVSAWLEWTIRQEAKREGVD